MRGLLPVLLFIPVCLVMLLVLEACRSDDPARIVKRSLANFGILAAVLLAGSAVVQVISRYL